MATFLRLERVQGFHFSAPGEARYVRLEFVGDGGAMAWSQPVFVEPPDPLAAREGGR